jgi:hypothetical protein
MGQSLIVVRGIFIIIIHFFIVHSTSFSLNLEYMVSLRNLTWLWVIRYQTLTLPEEDAANCLFVNGTLIHVSSSQAAESVQVYHRCRIFLAIVNEERFSFIGKYVPSPQEKY